MFDDSSDVSVHVQSVFHAWILGQLHQTPVKCQIQGGCMFDIPDL